MIKLYSKPTTDSNIEVYEYGTQVMEYNDFPEIDSLRATLAEELDLSLEGDEVEGLIERIENGEVEVGGDPEYRSATLSWTV